MIVLFKHHHHYLSPQLNKMVQIKEIINGVEITETIDGNIVVKLISHQSKPFIRTTNETDEETYQIIDKVGEIYNIPAIATDFVIIDVNGAVFIPADGLELIEYSYKIKAFRPDDESDIFHIGTIDTTSNSVTINLAGDGINWARISGSFYERYYPDTFNFTPVTTGQKILIIYAKPDAQVFHLAQGTEASEAVEPTYDGLFVARIIVDSAGTSIDEAVSGFREKAIDKWANLMASGGDMVLSLHHNQMRYRVSSSANDVRIGGFKNYVTDLLYSGIPLSIKNNTEGDIEFFNAVDASPLFIPIYSADLPFKIKKGETANFAWHTDNGFEIVKTGGGASFPVGANGQVLVYDDASPDGVVGSDRLTTAETEIDELQISQIEITTSASITNLTTSTGTPSGKVQHQRTVLVKNGVNAINITLESTADANFEAIYIKKGSASITFVAGSGVTLNKIANDGILNGIAGSGALVERDGSVYNIYVSNY